MGRSTVLALRVVLVLLLAVPVGTQLMFIWAAIAANQSNPGLDLTTQPFASMRVMVLIGTVAAEIFLISLWRLVTMAGGGGLVTHATTRPLNRIIVTMGATAAITLILSTHLAVTSLLHFGLLLIFYGAVVALLAIALLVLLLRTLLAKAVARDTEATVLRAELDEVI